MNKYTTVNIWCTFYNIGTIVFQFITIFRYYLFTFMKSVGTRYIGYIKELSL